MGPPPFGDGKTSWFLLLSAVQRRFNGATAFRRWKGPRCARLGPTRSRFNGATAFRRWKEGDFAWPLVFATVLQWGHRLSAMESPCHSLLPLSDFLASMGPPPFGDGKGALGRDFPTSGHRFNGATAFRRWKGRGRPGADRVDHGASMGPPPFGDGKVQMLRDTLTSKRELQWGHRLSAMESGDYRQPESRDGRASMGPPPFGDGKDRDMVMIALSENASMGPPPFGDGKLVRAVVVIGPVVRLQWGHRLSAMERAQSGTARIGYEVLQWGHRLSAMERSTRPACFIPV